MERKRETNNYYAKGYSLCLSISILLVRQQDQFSQGCRTAATNHVVCYRFNIDRFVGGVFEPVSSYSHFVYLLFHLEPIAYRKARQ